MGKLALLVLLFAVLAGLATPACAEFGTDWDWYVFLQAGNGTWNNLTQTWGCAGAELLLGCKPYPYQNDGPPLTSVSAYIRDFSSGAGAYGYTTDAHVPQYWPSYTWTNIDLWAGSGYPSNNMYLRIWGRNMDAKTPHVVLRVDYAKPGSGFTAGQVIFDTQRDSILCNATKHYPSLAIDLSPYISVLKTGTPQNPAVLFSMTAYANPGGLVPEPGSLVAMLTGLAGLAGFAIRRRK